MAHCLCFILPVMAQIQQATTCDTCFGYLTFDTPEMISVLLFVGVFRATLEADSVSCRMAVSATGSRPLERRLLSEQQKHKYVNQHYTIEIYTKNSTVSD